ncbi:MAG: GNAT family N-acetyltransferase [Cyanobacteria bacterium P01_E01_bin.42]
MSQIVRIFDVGENCWIRAAVVSIAAKHVRDFEEDWQGRLESMEEDDKYWDWAFKKRISLQDDNFEGYALECEDMTQGLMMLETRWHYSLIDGREGDRIVYIENLASAPWNRMGRVQAYRSTGRALLRFARQRSLELGYKGRVGLHSLPNAVGFYERCNMPDYGVDPDKDNLVYFEYGEFQG